MKHRWGIRAEGQKKERNNRENKLSDDCSLAKLVTRREGKCEERINMVERNN